MPMRDQAILLLEYSFHFCFDGGFVWLCLYRVFLFKIGLLGIFSVLEGQVLSGSKIQVLKSCDIF